VDIAFAVGQLCAALYVLYGGWLCLVQTRMGHRGHEDPAAGSSRALSAGLRSQGGNAEPSIAKTRI
jgi:hypothetical protein